LLMPAIWSEGGWDSVRVERTCTTLTAMSLLTSCLAGCQVPATQLFGSRTRKGGDKVSRAARRASASGAAGT
jgi:hypothetical protein